MCRSLIPVRSRIQVSLVSTMRESCSLVKMPGGTNVPKALILAVGKDPSNEFMLT
jgi:hypothetical protein